jgi:hypothetical protein
MVLYDTGANVVMMDETIARAAGLKITMRRGSVSNSTGTSGYTVGTAEQVPITLAKGKPWSVTLKLDIGIVKGVASLYELLLGTPFINPIGAFADPARQRMYYRPEWPVRANEQTIDRINFLPLRRPMPMTTRTKVASFFYKECSSDEGDVNDSDSDAMLFVGGQFEDGSF